MDKDPRIPALITLIDTDTPLARRVARGLAALAALPDIERKRIVRKIRICVREELKRRSA